MFTLISVTQAHPTLSYQLGIKCCMYFGHAVAGHVPHTYLKQFFFLEVAMLYICTLESDHLVWSRWRLIGFVWCLWTVIQAFDTHVSFRSTKLTSLTSLVHSTSLVCSKPSKALNGNVMAAAYPCWWSTAFTYLYQVSSLNSSTNTAPHIEIINMKVT